MVVGAGGRRRPARTRSPRRRRPRRTRPGTARRRRRRRRARPASIAACESGRAPARASSAQSSNATIARAMTARVAGMRRISTRRPAGAPSVEQRLQRCDRRLGLLELLGACARGGRGSTRLRAARSGACEDVAHLVDRHVEVAEPADRLGRADLARGVAPVPGRGVDARRFEQPDVVVVPERLHAQVRHLRELADRQQHVHGHELRLTRPGRGRSPPRPASISPSTDRRDRCRAARRPSTQPATRRRPRRRPRPTPGGARSRAGSRRRV